MLLSCGVASLVAVESRFVGNVLVGLVGVRVGVCVMLVIFLVVLFWNVMG